MGGCGGTLLSRCIGVLPHVALLSELNPRAVKLFPQFDPLYQDRAWLRLLAANETAYFSQKDLSDCESFRELIQVIHDRANAAGRHLVIRDYNFVDFVGVPFVPDPHRKLMLYSALPHSLATTSVALVRHPIDQWLSLCKHEIVRSVLSPSSFCEAYAAFLRSLDAKRIYRYEDFVQNPDAELRAICRDLALPFDASFIDRFHSFDHVTGDMTRLFEQSILRPKRKVLPGALIDEFRSSPSFEFIVQAIGYSESAAA